MSNTRAQRSKELKAKGARAGEAAEDAAENRAAERAEDREEAAKVKARTDAKSKPEPVPFNPPRVRILYPRWVTASIPEVGDTQIVVQSEAQEEAVKAKTATYRLTKSAQGDSYEIA
jgi:hypothetical protein